ncbi:unnamed protein product [Rotaria sp. Silwood1]|nr:unnamed protein product [Rotaria sp. Silwood1]CAF4969937.1 unnamed protein product [Rotaria sp. Silwood1]
MEKNMKKEPKNQTISHLYPPPLLTIRNEEYQQHFCDVNNQISDKTNFQCLSNQKFISNEMTTNDSSQISTLTKFCYKKICTKCIPESIHNNQDTNQQINIDLLYTYDPFQAGDKMQSYLISRDSFLVYDLKRLENFTDEQIQEFRQAFLLYDKDSDGAISPKVLGNVMRTLGQNPTEDELKGLINEFDCEGKGLIDFDEFLQMMAKRANEYSEEDELREAFRVFDKNGHGFIKVAELRHIMTNLGEQFSDNEVDEILREIDTSGNGIIRYDGDIFN